MELEVEVEESLESYSEEVKGGEEEKEEGEEEETVEEDLVVIRGRGALFSSWDRVSGSPKETDRLIPIKKSNTPSPQHKRNKNKEETDEGEEGAEEEEGGKRGGGGGEGGGEGGEEGLDEIKSYYKSRTKWGDKIVGWRRRQLTNWKMWVAFLLCGILFGVLAMVSETWESLEWRGWCTITIVVWMMVFMVWDVFDAVLVLFFVQTLVLLIYYTWDEGYCYCGSCVSDPDQYSIGGLQQCSYRSGDRAVAGYSNSGVLTVGILFVVAKGIEASSLLRFFTKYVLGKPSSLFSAQFRLLVPALVLSAFLNNTPIVAMLIPVVQGWAVQSKLDVSQLLMPLSFAAIMGGTCSLIGTSTNVIVSGLVEADPTIDFSIGFFSIATLGLPSSIVGLAYLFLFSQVLLPKSKDKGGDEEEGRRGGIFTVPILVTRESELIGKTLVENGLCTLEGVELFRIVKKQTKERKIETLVMNTASQDLKVVTKEESATLRPTATTTIMDPSPEMVVERGDVLYFSGQWEAVQMVFFLDGVVPNTLLITEVKGKRFSRCIVHVVLSVRSSMVGETIADANFPVRFNAAVVAISRQDLPVLIENLGDIVMEAGDVLVLEATTEFVAAFSHANHFALVSEKRSGSLTPRRISFTMVTIALSAFVMIALSAAGLLNLLAGAFLVTALYIIFNVLTWEQAKGAVNVDVLFIIAAAFGLGNLMQDTCVASAIATSLLSVFSYGGQLGILVGLYFSVALMSSVISNAACVTLMFPIAVNFSLCSNEVAISQHAAVFTLMMAGSAAFATPIGYQTNLMVMTPGKYVTSDFLKFGIPLTFLNMVVVCLLAWVIWPAQC